ncbi:MAG: NAD(P)/FAD-dependent oxidoreductase [Clostridia bacterium]|nr:NAD(P)/FAD-dependent oxidoreductase [Clostridia bacterium]
MMKILIIGGGPAGIIAGIKSAEEGNNVILLEKNDNLGKKLLITGKGRCNITSSLDISEFINNIPGNGRFLYSAFDNFNNNDIIELLKEEGLDVKEERGNRIFPMTDNARDVLNALLRRMKKLKIEIKLKSKVNKIIVEENKAVGIIYNDKERLYADKIILATGGKSYPTTGSTGDGYKIAKELGHTINEIKPSLVPLEIYQINECKQMQGLSLRNVGIKIIDSEKNKLIYEDFGEMLFAHFGVSGPVIISSSAHLVRYKNIEELLKNRRIILSIDLKPALTKEKLDDRILRDFNELKNRQVKNSLDKLLPQKMIPVVLDRLNIDKNKQVNEITKEERLKIIEILKNFKLEISGFRPIEEAIITAGGISIKEINPKTMESKIVQNLYFAGEIIDVDAYTGGFNLQIAYSTGYTAGEM